MGTDVHWNLGLQFRPKEGKGAPTATPNNCFVLMPRKSHELPTCLVLTDNKISEEERLAYVYVHGD